MPSEGKSPVLYLLLTMVKLGIIPYDYIKSPEAIRSIVRIEAQGRFDKYL